MEITPAGQKLARELHNPAARVQRIQCEAEDVSGLGGLR